MRHGHGHVVFVGRLDDIVIADGTAGLGDIGHAALVGALDVVAEREEGVGAEGDAGLLLEPCLFLLTREDGRFLGEDALPVVRLQEVFPLFANVDIDGVVAVWAADFRLERQIEDLRALAQEPVVGLRASEARAVDAALLAGADADGLAVLRVADGVGLRVLERDQGDQEVALCALWQVVVLRHDVLEAVFRDGDVVALLLKGDAEDLLALELFRLIGRIHLQDQVRALALRFEDLECFRRICGCDDAVGDLALEEGSRLGIALIRKGDEVAVGAHAVGAARADVGRGDRGELYAFDEVDFLEDGGEGNGDGSTGRADVLERSGSRKTGGFAQLADELPAVHRVEQVDVARAAVEDGERQLSLILHEDAGWLLVRVASVFEFQFFHFAIPSFSHTKKPTQIQAVPRRSALLPCAPCGHPLPSVAQHLVKIYHYEGILSRSVLVRKNNRHPCFLRTFYGMIKDDKCHSMILIQSIMLAILNSRGTSIMLKSIAVLTSGGDSPGMNAAARAVVRTALYEGVKVWGIRGGYHGLLEEDMFEMKSRDVSDIIQRGGTFLGTARCKRWKTPEGRMMGYKHLTDRGIEGLCVIGGDGSLRGASLLSKETGIPIVGLPGTIDNDVWGSDYTIGCDTAANTIIDAINKLRDTASAHRRVIVLEVMGRNCGWLALVSGISGGAEYILVPEEEYNLDEICDNMTEAYKKGKRYILVVVAEGAGSGQEIGQYIAEKTQLDTRVSVLGHIQRGGSPSVIDRVRASQLGEQAALALISGLSDIVFGYSKGRVVSIDLHDAVNNKKILDPDYLHLAKVLF